MIKLAVIGLGKMGLSHLAIANGLDGIEVVAIVDPAPLVGAGLSRITGIRHISDYRDALKLKDLDAVIVATPTVSHEQIVRDAIDRGVHLFCEKPLTLSADVSRELAALAEQRARDPGWLPQSLRRLFRRAQATDRPWRGRRISHVLGEVYGPVVTRPAKMTWRGKAEQGGGALMDYAAHPINLLNWYFGSRTHAIARSLTRSSPRGGRPGQCVAPLRRCVGTAVGQLVGFVAAQDDQPGHDMGRKGKALRRSAGTACILLGPKERARRLHGRLERAVHDRADQARRVLHPRRGIFSAAGSVPRPRRRKSHDPSTPSPTRRKPISPST